MEEKKIFQLGNMTLAELVSLLEQFLDGKHLTTQKFNLGNRAILQCVDSDSNWKQFLGLDAALTIDMTLLENNTLSVSIGNAKWLDKVGVGAIGALFFSPLLLVAGVGAVRQAILPTEIFEFIKNQTSSKATQSFVKKQPIFEPESEPEQEEQEETAICPCCGSVVLTSHAFCSKCGTKL